MKIALGLILAFAIGAVCRFIDIPLPAPPTVKGVVLVCSITLGFWLTDHLLARLDPAAPGSGEEGR